MAKNIVICCDGTGDQFGEQTSNVVKLYKTLVRDADQVAYYHPGVGTMGSRTALSVVGRVWTRIIGLAFGYGISDNLADAYQFLMNNFEPGDQVYVFGFSRGAYTARALCGMLHAVGLLTRGNEGLIPYAIRMIKRNKIDFAVAADFKKTFSGECKPYFVGVWDTVSSLGWVYDPVNFPFTRATKNPDLHIVRHAVSIDERRAFFQRNSFGSPHDSQQDVMEVWFAGVHSDVGGGYPEPESQLSKIALRWMLCEAENAGLRVDAERKAEILGGKATYVLPDPTTKNQHKTLHGFWWIAEFVPKVVSRMTTQGAWHKSLKVNFGRRRKVPPNPLVHKSVEERLADAKLGYKPSNLPKERRTAEDRCQD